MKVAESAARLRVLVVTAAAVMCCPGLLFAGFPKRPSMRRTMIFDYAQIITPDAEAQIHKLQLEAYKKHDMAIVVVTIRKMDDYGPEHRRIESFAVGLLKAWRIGKGGNNTGALFLISVGDRKARLELGTGWGVRWDGYCKRLMRSKIVPAFRKSRYSEGALEAVRGLNAIGERGVNGQPPAPTAGERFRHCKALEELNRGNPIPPDLHIWLLIAGAILIVVGSACWCHAKALVLGGVVCILAVYAFWAAVVVMVLYLGILQAIYGGGCYHRRGYYGGYHSHSHYGGGFFTGGSSGGGGGFSGGGGATGSW